MTNLLKVLILFTFIHVCVFCSRDTDEILTTATSPTNQVSDSLLSKTPEAARNYIIAVNQNSPDALVDAFDARARVVDVTRNITGHTAIRTWAKIGRSLRIIEIHIQTAASNATGPLGAEGLTRMTCLLYIYLG